jgi:hypothetical protein
VDNPALPERRRFPRFAAQDGESRAFAHIPTGNHNQPEFLNRFKEVDEADRPVPPPSIWLHACHHRNPAVESASRAYQNSDQAPLRTEK